MKAIKCKFEGKNAYISEKHLCWNHIFGLVLCVFLTGACGMLFMKSVGELNYLGSFVAAILTCVMMIFASVILFDRDSFPFIITEKKYVKFE